MSILDYDLLPYMWRLVHKFQDKDLRIFDWYKIYQMDTRYLLHIRACNLEVSHDIRVGKSRLLGHLSLDIDCWDRMGMESKDSHMPVLQLIRFKVIC